MNGLDYGPKFGRKPSAESQQIIAEQAERIRQLEAALRDSTMGLIAAKIENTDLHFHQIADKQITINNDLLQGRTQ